VAPENTLAGFEAALNAGADYLETDVQRSADGVLVLMHDPTVDRTTNGRGAVAETKLDDLVRLDAGSWFDPRFADQRVLSFADFMRWIEARAPFGAVIEAKASGVGAEIADAVARSPAREHLSICSFRSEEIAAAKKAQPAVPCVLLFHTWRPREDPLELMWACGADGGDLPWQWLDPELAKRVHEAGLLVGGGTANDERAVDRLVALGAHFVDSDRPTMAVRARDALSAAW
jgi:glycerophosphoryl diester phosphodiesterase